MRSNSGSAGFLAFGLFLLLFSALVFWQAAADFGRLQRVWQARWGRGFAGIPASKTSCLWCSAGAFTLGLVICNEAINRPLGNVPAFAFLATLLPTPGLFLYDYLEHRRNHKNPDR